MSGPQNGANGTDAPPHGHQLNSSSPAPGMFNQYLLSLLNGDPPSSWHPPSGSTNPLLSASLGQGPHHHTSTTQAAKNGKAANRIQQLEKKMAENNKELLKVRLQASYIEERFDTLQEKLRMMAENAMNATNSNRDEGTEKVMRASSSIEHA